MTDTTKRLDLTGGASDLLVDVEPTGTPSVLAGLKAELAKKVANEPVTLVIPSRPNIRLTFDTNLDTHVVQMWRKRSADRTMPDGIDTLKFSSIVIANSLVKTEFQEKGTWVEMFDAEGNPLTFKSPEFMEMLGEGTAVGNVRKLYGSDAAIFKAVEAIFSAAGFDSTEDEVVEDPTLIS